MIMTLLHCAVCMDALDLQIHDSMPNLLQNLLLRRYGYLLQIGCLMCFETPTELLCSLKTFSLTIFSCGKFSTQGRDILQSTVDLVQNSLNLEVRSLFFLPSNFA